MSPFSLSAAAASFSGDETAIIATGAVGLFITMVGLVFGLPEVIAGWGLWQKKSWARILAIILGILNLFAFPVGTAPGIYTLWILFKPESEKLLAA